LLGRNCSKRVDKNSIGAVFGCTQRFLMEIILFQMGQEMSGIFSPNSALITDVNLMIQIVSFLIGAVAIGYKIKKNYRIHGMLMGIGVILHLVFFAVAMWPSFSGAFDFFTTSTSSLGVQAMWVHAIPGLITIILGLYVLVSWLLHVSDISRCFKKKRIMDVVLISWVISVIFGIGTYLYFYT
jgi:hypothetical protein